MEVEMNKEYQGEKVEVKQVDKIDNNTLADDTDNQEQSNIEDEAVNGDTQPFDDGEATRGETQAINEATRGETQAIDEATRGETQAIDEATCGETQAIDDVQCINEDTQPIGDDEAKSNQVDENGDEDFAVSSPIDDAVEDSPEVGELQEDIDSQKVGELQEDIDSQKVGGLQEDIGSQKVGELQEDIGDDNTGVVPEAVDTDVRDAEVVDVDTADDNIEDNIDINTDNVETTDVDAADDDTTPDVQAVDTTDVLAVNTTDVHTDDKAVEEPAPTPVNDVKPATIPENKDSEDKENKQNGGNNEQNNNSIRSSISKFGAPAKKEKGMFKVVQTEKCAACQKTVYAMEKLEMNGHIYHKNCFKCSHCSARLTPKTFSMNEGVIYCVNHFKQLFARKGNYDEGFGRQQYKKKWGGDKKEDATA